MDGGNECVANNVANCDMNESNIIGSACILRRVRLVLRGRAMIARPICAWVLKRCV